VRERVRRRCRNGSERLEKKGRTTSRNRYRRTMTTIAIRFSEAAGGPTPPPDDDDPWF